ncbi:peptidoglycan recognition protein family protein [Staphylococcus pasteuri]|uniref:peptidoglycan recognition protein family protein n=1 Tax=Staphylococcus pasteuri TaxID=45972 RepID=UPI003CC8D31C
MATENWKGVKVRYQLLTKGTRRYGETMDGGKPQFIVAHDTGNINTTAQSNVTYYENTYNIPWNSVASAHIFVDDKECIICIPTTEKAWHVLYDAPTDNLLYNKDANDVAIGVEICYFSDRERSKKALDNGARVLAYLAEYWHIDYKTRMPGHQDIQADKQDPGNALEASGYGRNTSNLDKLIAKYYKQNVKVKATPVKVEKGATSFTRDEFVKWLKSTEGKQYDYDLYAAFQCFDYANVGWDKLFGHGLKGNGAKDIPFNVYNKDKFKNEATVFKNTPSFLAKPGDLVVWGEQMGDGWGSCCLGR